jgi:diguanylate cyclase (GGDEF)-like protein
MSGSWLCREDIERERLLDMEEHLRPVRAVTMALIVGVAFVSTGFVDIKVFLIVIAGVTFAASLFWIADARMKSSERPEYVMFAAWVGAQLAIAACVVLTGGPDSPGVAWLAIPVVTLSSRFSTRGVVLGLSLTLALLIGVTVGVDAAAIADDPTLLSAPAVVIICVAVLSIALMRSDRHHRGAAVIDPLTGMLNRKALSNRILELTEQSAVTGQPVGLIMGDLDHFKRVNDSLGHATGDGVLRDVAYLLRKRLRAFDLSYRIGGEEFLVVLPGADGVECMRIAEELRAAIQDDAFGGIETTMSFGVSASTEGEPFDYDRVFAAADAALYEAKRAGRNRVRVDALAQPGEAELPALA